MRDDIKRVAQITGGNVLRAPEIELSSFGIALLAERLEPAVGKRPGRPTDPSWGKVAKLPMSDETQNILRLLSDKFSTRRRRISPMQVAAYLLEEEVRAYRDVFKFLDDTNLRSVWDIGDATRDQQLHAYERDWAIIEFKDSQAIESPLLWEASKQECLTTSILYAGILREYGHVVIRGDLLGTHKEKLRRFAEHQAGRLVFHDNMKAFRETRPTRLSSEPVLLKQFDTRHIHRFRYPLAVVDQPYLYNLARHFDVEFTVCHATVMGSHGYLDVQLAATNRADELIAFARRLGVNVRRVHREDFWDDLRLDSEEEIRRSLVAVREQGEDWQSLPPESDNAVDKILKRFIEQYELFPGHYSIGDWLFAASSETVKPPVTDRLFTPLQVAARCEIAALVERAGGPQMSWSSFNTVVDEAA